MPQAVRAANLQLLQLNKTATQVNTQFAHLGRRALTGLLGLAGITGIAEVARKGIELAKEEAGVRAALNNLIANQNKLRGVGLQQSKQQVEMLERQARTLQGQTGIYSGLLLKGDVYLSQFKLSAQQIAAMQPAMANLLTYQRQLGRSAESFPAVYEAVGKAIQTGMGRGLKSVGVELTAQQQQWLRINAMMGNYAANARMIAAEIQRQHGGAAAQFRGTLGGQAAIAMAQITSGMEKIGEALRPLIQVGQIIVSRFVTPLLDKFGQLNNLVTNQWRGWVAYIDRYVVPAFKTLVAQGWDLLLKAIDYFKRNSSWLLPLLKNVVIGWLAWQFAIKPIAGYILDLINPLTRVQAAIKGIAVAIAAVTLAMADWRHFRNMLVGITEQIFGTAFIDPLNRGFAARRAFPKDVVPRALPVYKGWLNEMGDMFNRWQDEQATKAHKKLVEFLTGQHRTLKDWLNVDLNNEFDVWQDDLATAMHKRWFTWVDTFVEYVKTKWSELMKYMGVGVPGTGQDFQRTPGGTVTPRTSSIPSQFTGGPERTGYRKAYEQYPWEGRSSNYYGNTYLGVPNEIGLGQILQRQWGVRPERNDWVKVQFKDGTVMWRRVMETSMAPGGAGIEFWSAKRGEYERHGAVRVLDVRHGGPPPPNQAAARAAAAASTRNITIHYSPTYHHSGPLDEQRLAHLHRRHIDHLRRDIAEAEYMNNRAAFDGASPI